VVHHEFSISCLVSQGRFEQAVAENRRARELEPLSPSFMRGYTWLLIHARRFGEAERECRPLLAEGGDPVYFRNQSGLVLFGQRRYEEACAELEATDCSETIRRCSTATTSPADNNVNPE
jgi:Flp pilus assembly protein TadD